MPLGKAGATGHSPGEWPVFKCAEIDSTNSEAMRRAVGGAKGPLWIVAERQTSGRGRSGRSWASEPGNLYASLLIEPGCPTELAYQLSLLAGVAAIDALRTAGAGSLDGLRLKWPNDLLLGPAKLGGILVESTVLSGRLMAVVGIGLNLAWNPTDAGRPATNLASHGVRLSPGGLLNYLSDSFALAYKAWEHGRNFAAIRASWLDRAGPIGERVAVNAGQGLREGTFAGLDESGALLLAGTDGSVVRFTFGDVTLTGEMGREGCRKSDA